MRNHSTMLLALSLMLTASLLACRSSSDTTDREAATSTEPQAATAEDAPEGHVYDPGDRWNLVGDPVKGSEDAIVTIVEFSEFQCPFCSRVLPTLTQILETEEFAGKVRIVFQNMPLSFHEDAHLAGQAALAAHDQGKFWEYHDILFANMRALKRADLEGYAEQLELDMDAFRAALDNETHKEQVDAEIALAGTLGIRGTPNFMINGRNLRGAQPFPAFETIIREEIAAMEALIEGGKSASEAYAARLDENATANAAAANNNNNNNNNQRPARPTPDPDAELYVPVGASPFKGPADALVTIVEFSEFQCPFCSRVMPTLDQIMETYGDDVRVVFKHNPLSFHDRAEPAARAAIAAQAQGKFWEYHDILFANMRALSDEDLERYAEQVGLNMDQFRSVMQAEETGARIREEQQLSQRLAARGTPHFFVNGIRLRGAQPFERFKTVIDEQLEIARAAVAGGVARADVYEHLQSDAIRGNAPMIQPPAAAAAPTPAAPAAPAEPVEINVGNSPARGSADAPVTVAVWTDFQCPFCGRFADNLEAALENFTDEQVRVTVKAFPLGFHQQAHLAAQASLAANAQGKFFEYHDMLFENMRNLMRPDLERYAEELGLNMEQFRAALDDGTYAAQVDAEMAEGRAVGVTGTPGWFVNGTKFGGARPPEQIQQAIQTALDAAE